MATNDLLVWVDCEMTGLDLINDELIEVAALVTDADLNVLGDGVDLVIKPSSRALEQMGDFVRGMHDASGLLSLLDSGLSLAEAEQRVLDYVRAFVAEPGKAPSPATLLAPIGRSWPGTCRHSSVTFTTAVLMSPASRSWYAAGTHGSTTRPRPRRAIIGRSPTCKSPLRSCGTTARRCSYHCLARTAPRRRRLPITTRVR